jgi:hypothetical protein
MKISNRTRAGIAAVACAAVGAAGGIAASAAAPGQPSAGSSTKATPSAKPARAAGRRHGGPGHAVHAEAVVLNKAGTAFITETIDNGKLKSVSGRDITITEAIGSVTYKDVTITLPADAKIVRNGKTATIGALKTGDRIGVSQSSDGTFVHAADASFRPRRHGHGGPHPGGPHPGGRRPG